MPFAGTTLWTALTLLLATTAAAADQAAGADDTKVYAVYFPQFHEDRLNNYLWGKGFTGLCH